MSRLVPALLATGLVAAALWPSLQARRAAHRAAARLEALAARAASGACLAEGPLDGSALSLRAQRLGPWLASWETVGGCGAGGGASVGTGVKWIGHSTTGGLFQVVQQGNYVRLTPDRSTGMTSSPGYNYISATQITTDLSDKWVAGLSVPLIYKYYYHWLESGYDVSNGGLGDISAMVTRKLGRINATTLTGIVGLPSGTYQEKFMGTALAPDQQLGFGRVTGTLMLDHTLDQTWGLIVLGAAGGYRGGKNSESNYRAPGGSIYSYVGYFLGPLVPSLGVTMTGFTRQDQIGDAGETINAPVATFAGNASLEWSNDYLALLVGAQVPYAIRGRHWSEGPQGPGRNFGLQPWTLAIGISVSPF